MVDLASRLARLVALRERLPASSHDDLDMLASLLVVSMKRPGMRDTDEATARAVDRFLTIDDVPTLCERLASAAEAMRIIRGAIN